jgi:hypothetical protein
MFLNRKLKKMHKHSSITTIKNKEYNNSNIRKKDLITIIIIN